MGSLEGVPYAAGISDIYTVRRCGSITGFALAAQSFPPKSHPLAGVNPHAPILEGRAWRDERMAPSLRVTQCGLRLASVYLHN